MHDLPPGPASVSMLDFLQAGFVSPVPFMKRQRAMYGDTFRLEAQGELVTFTGDPEVIRTVYTLEPDAFDMRAADLVMPIFGRTSLTVSTDARHRRDRRLLSPPFNVAAMRGYAASMAASARAKAATWRPGRPFSMLAATQSIALDIIVRVVFGVEGEAQIEQTRAAVLRLIHALNPWVLVFPSLRRDFGGYGPWARLNRASEALQALLTEQIRVRRTDPGAREDVLSILVRTRDEDGTALDDAELAEQLRTLLFAGHETTATALAWAVWLLHRHPEALARVRDEIERLGPTPAPEAFASLPFLEACCYEALRMCPPVVDVGRVLRKPLQVGRFTIPAGETIVPAPLLLHLREDLYPEPERFRPERFLDKRPSPFELIAFGGGVRRCLGAAFAIYEMKVVLGSVLREHRLRIQGDAPLRHVRRGITMGPRGKVPMVLVARWRAPARPAAITASSG